jgi:Flp pilus assembly pilin Flp
MQRVLVAVQRLLRKDDGQDLIEYGLLVVLIALAAVVAVGTLGTTIHTAFWDNIANASF